MYYQPVLKGFGDQRIASKIVLDRTDQHETDQVIAVMAFHTWETNGSAATVEDQFFPCDASGSSSEVAHRPRKLSGGALTDDSEKPSLMITSVSLQLLRGSIAGTVAKTTVYPFDRLKMIYQVGRYYYNHHRGGRRSVPLLMFHHQVKGSVVGPFKLRAFFGHIRSLIASEGVLSLWKGNLAAVSRYKLANWCCTTNK